MKSCEHYLSGQIVELMKSNELYNTLIHPYTIAHYYVLQGEVSNSMNEPYRAVYLIPVVYNTMKVLPCIYNCVSAY